VFKNEFDKNSLAEVFFLQNKFATSRSDQNNGQWQNISFYLNRLTVRAR